MLIRSLRNFSHKYYNELLAREDLSDPCFDEITMETGSVKSSDEDDGEWPTSIALNTSIHSIKIKNNNSTISRFRDDKLKGQMQIYNNPRVLENSPITIDSIVEKIVIKYEKSGSYIKDKARIEFFDANLGICQLNLDEDDIFEKKFAVTCKNIIENSTKDGIILQHNRISTCNLYPYGGFYTYGCHPKQIESCVFRAQVVDEFLSIKIHQLSSIHNFDPLVDTILDSGKMICGAKNLNTSQKKSLYDEIIQGDCHIQLLKENKKQNYRSNAVVHIANTNMLIINFIKEK